MDKVIIGILCLLLFTIEKGIVHEVFTAIILTSLIGLIIYTISKKYIFKNKIVNNETKTLEIVLNNNNKYKKTKFKGSMNAKNTLIQSKSYRRIKEIDEEFDGYKFMVWFKNIFIKYQKALEEKEISIIKKFSTDEFYEKKQKEIEQQKKIEDFVDINFDKITNTKITSYKKKENKESIVVCVEYDEIMDEYNPKTRKKIKGVSGRKVKNIVYVLLEKNEEKTSNGKIGITNCPNCGAPTQIISTGKCSYCGNIIEHQNQDWKIVDVWTKKEQMQRTEELDRALLKRGE